MGLWRGLRDRAGIGVYWLGGAQALVAGSGIRPERRVVGTFGGIRTVGAAGGLCAGAARVALAVGAILSNADGHLGAGRSRARTDAISGPDMRGGRVGGVVGPRGTHAGRRVWLGFADHSGWRCAVRRLVCLGEEVVDIPAARDSWRQSVPYGGEMAQTRHAQTARQSGLVAPLSARRGRRAGVGHQVGGPVFLAVLESARRKPGHRGPDCVVVRSGASRDARVLPLPHFTVLSRSIEHRSKEGANRTRTGGEQSFQQ